MRFFSKLRWPKRLSSVSTAAPSSRKNSLMVLESTARGMDAFYQRFAEPAAGVHLSECGTWAEPPDTWLTLESALPNHGEDYLGKLLRLGRRPGSLLMRVDSRGLDDTTYVVGKTLLRIRVQTLNPSRNRSRWLEP